MTMMGRSNHDIIEGSLLAYSIGKESNVAKAAADK
jgi:hypothetical protein